jgi:hypothetical protein
VIPFLGPQGAFDFRFLGGAGVGSCSAMAFSAVAGNYSNLPSLNGLGGQQGGSSVGLYMPLIGNNDDCQIGSFAAQGFTYGINVTEHVAAQRLSAVYCIVGAQCVGGGAHGNWIGYMSAEACVTAIQFTGAAPLTLSVDYLDTETISTWHIQDTQNALYGRVLVHTNSGSAPAVQAASHMEVIWDGLGPGVWSGAPAVPASGTAQQNTAWRPATVYVNGTLTGNTKVDGTSLGTAAAVVRVPGGHTITLTYAVAPTWVWVLD